MKTLKTTKKTSATDHEYTCDFCGRGFKRETTLLTHICETKRRYQDKDLAPNRIGFQLWCEFYRKNTYGRKVRTYLEFAKSSYYLAFVKFGKYCIDIKCVNINCYMDWLIDNKIGVDSWAKDSNYDKFLASYLRVEDHLDALARSIETTIEYAKNDNIKSSDYLRYGNKNRICSLVMNGKISPWMLYQSESGVEFIDSLDEKQLSLIMDYINPQTWAMTFHKNPEKAAEVKALLKEAGY